MIKFSLKVAVIISLILTLLSCKTPEATKIQSYYPGEIMTLGISEDGNTVISAGKNGGLLRWDIDKRTYTILAKDANPYSIYLLKGKRKFVWQDKKNIVHLSDFSGKSQLNFKAPKKAYSGALTNDNRYYFMSDILWNKYRYDTINKKWSYIDRHAFASFLAAGKPLNMSLSMDSKYLLTSGACNEKFQNIPVGKQKAELNLDCVVLWDVAKEKPIRKFSGNRNATVGVLSPKADTVVTGDENGIAYFFKGNKKIRLDNIYFGKFLRIAHTGDEAKDYKWDADNIIPPPKNYVSWDGGRGSDNVSSIKFITEKQYVRLNNYTFFAILYDAMSRKPKKYLNMGKMPWPATADSSRSGAIDTSLKTHTLVIGQASFDGINVYKFDPKTETLYRVWSPILNKPPTAPKSLSKDVPTLPGITFKQLSEVKKVDGFPAK